MKITSAFAGGNCEIISITQENGKTVVNLQQQLRDTTVWWFYWCFRVEDAPAGEVVFIFNNGDVVSPHGPATCTDGIHWQWCPEALIDHKRFSYTFDGKEKCRYFAFSLPYVTADFERFYSQIKSDTAMTRSQLTVSEKGRELPLLTFGSGDRDILLTARHHCCESTASYALEGIITAILSTHRAALQKFRFHVVPFVDIDGVEQGDQGKDRAPHDHNRDYIEQPIYNYTRAIYEYTKQMKLAAFIDIHSPWLWGWRNDVPHIHFAPAAEPTPDLQDEFSKRLQQITAEDTRNIIPYDDVIIRVGEDPNYIEHKNAKNFFKLERGANLSISFEVPYMGNLKHGYTVEQLHILGEHIAQALIECFE